MQPTLADLAAALARDPDPDLRAALEELAAVVLPLRILQWQNARIGALLCRLSLDSRVGGGDDDQRDAAAA